MPLPNFQPAAARRAVSAPVTALDGAPAIDMAHLSRQSLGDHELELDLLRLFDRQAARISAELGMPDLSRDCSAERLDLAHTLKGSARAVGAHRVADGCEALESLLRAHAPQPALDGAVREIRQAVAAVRDFVAQIR